MNSHNNMAVPRGGGVNGAYVERPKYEWSFRGIQWGQVGARR